jgi:hypothetical protein
MKNRIELNPLPEEVIIRKIYWIKGNKVMMDFDLATLYGVSTKVLKQAVKRNRKRFPKDFLFELTKSEFENLRSQIVTSSWGCMRYLPMPVFFQSPGASLPSSLANHIYNKVPNLFWQHHH